MHKYSRTIPEPCLLLPDGEAHWYKLRQRLTDPVSRYNLQVPQALEEGDEGFLVPKWPKNVEKQSQFHPDLMASNGTFYWARSTAFLKKHTFYADRLKGYEIPWIRAIDLDTPEDYEIAQLVASAVFQKESGAGRGNN